MKKSEVKEGQEVWVQIYTFKKVTVVRQVNAYRTVVKFPDGKEAFASTRALVPVNEPVK